MNHDQTNRLFSPDESSGLLTTLSVSRLLARKFVIQTRYGRVGHYWYWM
jgi:hypothetical protein